jgi:serine/threonine protein kinase
MIGTSDRTGDTSIDPVGGLVAGRYRLRLLLGQGGMARVWLGEDELLHRLVALKQATSGGQVSDATRADNNACALCEARAAARVDHPAVVTIYDTVIEGSDTWIVMEALSGRTLAEVLDAEGPLSIDQVAYIGLCLLDALRATHQAGIVHRDVKPGNVHLCTDGRVVLTDFGVAWTMNDQTASSPIGRFAGSPAYVSPEQVQGEPVPASDLFGLGSTLFEAVEGRRPFARGSLSATLNAVFAEAPGPFLRAGPLRAPIEGLLAKAPERRLSVGEARAALRDLRLDGRPADKPPGLGYPRQRHATADMPLQEGATRLEASGSYQPVNS